LIKTEKMQTVDAQELQADVIIVGGGLAGLSMAAALSSMPINIVILEHAKSLLGQESDGKESEQVLQSNYSPSFDDRALALTSTSMNILSNVGVLSSEDIALCTPIQHINVSDKGHFGMLRMSASEVDEKELGRVIPASLLGQNLNQYIARADFKASISLFDHSEVQQITQRENNAVVEFLKNKELQVINSQLVILADGGRSGIAEQAGLSAITTDYQQVGVLANVKVDKSHDYTAYERFTKSGPVALLPLRQDEYKLVWSVDAAKPEEVLSWSDSVFLDELQRHFGFRAGQFLSVGKRMVYPMQSKIRSQIVSGRIALIGNAAHSLHPIAGQGFNLGLRDVASLTEILIEKFNDANNQMNDVDVIDVLFRYQQDRKADIKLTSTFTDQLVKSFSTSNRPIAILRTLGLLALDRQPSLKRKFMQKLMGFSGQKFQLAKKGS